MKKELLNRLLSEHQLCNTCPSLEEVDKFFKELMGLLYMDYAKAPLDKPELILAEEERLKVVLEDLLSRNPMNAGLGVNKITVAFFDALLVLQKRLLKDVMAIYEGDPACKSRREVIRSYPGFYAIAAYRIAHQLHILGVEDLPRIITEHAHSQTGIDIHPGAEIGDSFCIDHGTGIVIGETTIIKKNVKIYQGVTLGALSVDKSDADKKRHPTIEEGCVLYAGATILGGETIIGTNSIIGGNTWITRSVPPHSKIYYQAVMNTEDGGIDKLVFKDYAK